MRSALEMQRTCHLSEADTTMHNVQYAVGDTKY